MLFSFVLSSSGAEAWSIGRRLLRVRRSRLTAGDEELAPLVAELAAWPPGAVLLAAPVAAPAAPAAAAAVAEAVGPCSVCVLEARGGTGEVVLRHLTTSNVRLRLAERCLTAAGAGSEATGAA